ncbi:hypothetical protein I8J29_32805 [Paenibacillus sp. MWE-103]|uniref:Uncharacterized protein n=1 Tax=Paenibacillus artemisiicola TaxID=1172618 RepID=A0ABS3WKU6_9BACL|nr:hypothetical protein [Paenibacillus artemisiicola]MBO7748954.1 hypothetical protein [Paenibacillus artemisiicola]
MKWTAIVLILLIVLTGCSKDKDYYGGITKDKMTDITNDSKLEYLHEFKGHTDNWGAMMYFYKTKDSEKVSTRGYLIYNGKDELPTGEVTVLYQVDEETGSFGMITAKQNPPTYAFLFSTSTSPTSQSKVKVVVQTRDKSETIELKMN